MKIRTDFVTNSSSSSFVFIGYFSKELLEYLNKLIDAGYEHHFYGEATMRSEGHIVSKQAEALVDALSYVPYQQDKPEKIGFQIEQRSFQGDDPFYALLDYIDFDRIPPEKTDEIYNELERLVNEAEEQGLITQSYGSYSTDAGWLCHYFREIDYDKAYYKITPQYNLAECKNKNLEEAVVYYSYRKIMPRAFAKMPHLRRVEFKNVEAPREIADRAFADCTALEEVIGLDRKRFIGLERIGKAAFKNCVSLQELCLPASIREIAPDAFAGCTKLVLKGKEGSYVQKYAEEHNIPFIAVDAD